MKHFPWLDRRWRPHIVIAALTVYTVLAALLVATSHKHQPGAALGPEPPKSKVAAPRMVPSAAATPTPARVSTPTQSPLTARSPRPHTSPYKSARWTFDNGTSGWAGGPAAVGFGAHTPVVAGAGSLGIRNASTDARTVTVSSGVTERTLTPARPGMRVIGAVAIRADDAPRTTQVTVQFLDSRGGLLEKAGSQTVTDSTQTWRQSYDAVGIAPPATAYVILQVSVVGAASGETHYVDNATLIEYPGGSADVVGPLRTSGRQILDGRGHNLIFRGFTRVGLEGANADPPTQDDIAHAKAWGANIIRLSLGEQFWLTSSCHYRPGFAAQVDDAVRMVTDLGMVALLDLHWNSLTSCGSYGQQPMADYPGAITFWDQVADRYKNNPLVAFDLYNEPHDISDTVWRSGGQVTWKGVTYTAAGMQQMYAAVRSTGARNLVIASGNAWGNLWPSTAPLAGDNVVYGIHAYTCQVSPPPNCDNPAPYDPKQFFQFWTGPARHVPVAVTEFGWPDPADGRYLSAVIAYAEARGWGWTAFTWGDATWGPFSLLATAGPGHAYEPRPTGQVVLAAFPGG